MQRLHWWFVALIAWFVGLYNIERYHEPINLTGVFYLFTPGFAVLLLVWPSLQRISLPRLMLLAVAAFLVLKVAFGYRVIGARLPVTITEIVAIEIAVILARQVGQALQEFRAAVFDVMCCQLYNSSRPFETGQAEMYREVRRARDFHRPLALLAIATAGDVQEATLNRIIEEVQHESVKKYVAARIAHLLAEETKDCDIITQRNNHFVILLPEVGRSEAAARLRKVENAARQKLGLEFKFGLATFPDEEVTFEGLVERAEAILHGSSALATENPLAGTFEIVAADGKEDARPDSDAECDVIRLETPELRQSASASSGTTSAS